MVFLCLILYFWNDEMIHFWSCRHLTRTKYESILWFSREIDDINILVHGPYGSLSPVMLFLNLHIQMANQQNALVEGRDKELRNYGQNYATSAI